VIAVAGSSSAQQYLSSYGGLVIDARVQVTRDGTSLAPLQSGAFGEVAGQAIYQATGRSVIFIDAGVPGATLAGWAGADSSWRQRLVSSIKAVGRADMVLLQVGWNDAARGSVRSREDQFALFRSLIGSIRTEASVPDVPILLGAAQNLSEATAGMQNSMAFQRLAEQDAVISIPNVTYAFSTYDLPTNDGVHQTEEGQLVSGRRFAEQAIAKLAGQTAPRGPRGTRVRRITDTVSQVDLILSTDTGFLPTSGLDGFFVQDAAGLTAATSAVRLDGRTIQVTHRALDPQRATIRYALDSRLGHPGFVRDNSAFARPMEPMLLPVT
jgi:lysophospholipase L1-like esterase